MTTKNEEVKRLEEENKKLKQENAVYNSIIMHPKLHISIY